MEVEGLIVVVCICMLSQMAEKWIYCRLVLLLLFICEWMYRRTCRCNPITYNVYLPGSALFRGNRLTWTFSCVGGLAVSKYCSIFADTQDIICVKYPSAIATMPSALRPISEADNSKPYPPKKVSVCHIVCYRCLKRTFISCLLKRARWCQHSAMCVA